MTSMTDSEMTAERIPFRMHPRVFAALGADLVTNDVVAVIEVVKNSYDAYATRVDVRFGRDPGHGEYLEVEDNGCGMDRQTIEDVWCVVATPFRIENPVSRRGKRIRRVAGEKGLGRLSTARLGSRLEMLTQSRGQPCWRVRVDWSEISTGDDISACGVDIRLETEGIPFRTSGTRVRVLGLKSEWDAERVADLEDNLRRLVSPFAQVDDFTVFLTPPEGAGESVVVEVSAPEFLSKPKYAIRGTVGQDASVRAKYEFVPVGTGKPRGAEEHLTWQQIVKASDERGVALPPTPEYGPFEFEIRAWDIGSGDTEEIAERYEVTKSSIRKAIRAHKGISVYRDGILALPKSENARDWLGLDLRRVSKVGTRVSTSQIVGYVSISADKNPRITDTSDREGFANNPAVLAFQETLKTIVYQLENERDKDRLRPTDEERLSELFEDLTADDLLAEMVAIADEGAPAADAIPILREFGEKLDSVRAAIKKRFTYYSRLATIGTIAQMLVHEIRNRTTIFGRFVRTVAKRLERTQDEQLTHAIEQAGSAVASLEQLADTFAPLASRAFRRRRRDSVLEESIRRCLGLLARELRDLKAEIKTPSSETRVAVDPGELDAIILNLVSNATYWLRQPRNRARLEFRLSRMQHGRRVKLTVDDSGPGVPEDDADKVFLPGVTRKPGGIGMGLTVASELVAEYGGQMCLVRPGRLGGATFSFDLPVKQEKGRRNA